MSETAPVEVTRKYVTTVSELFEAWAFVMDHLDDVGPDPQILVSPVWVQSWAPVDAEQPARRFEVSVSGMVHA